MARTLGAGLVASACLVLPAVSSAMVREGHAWRYAPRSRVECAYPRVGKGFGVSCVSVDPRCLIGSFVRVCCRVERNQHDHGQGRGKWIMARAGAPSGPNRAATHPDLP